MMLKKTLILILLLSTTYNINPLITCSKPTALFSNSLRKDLKRALIDKICRAQAEIVISTYSLSDAKIIALLNQKAATGIDIQIYIDKKHAPSLRSKLRSSIKVIQQPQRGLMHHKLVIVDDDLFLGSANLTSQSLRMHDNLTFLFHNQSLAVFFKKALKTPGCGSYFNGDEIEVFVLPNPKALPKVLQRINQAQRKILVAMFTFTHPLIVSELIHVKQGGIYVEVISDHLSSKGASKKALHKLYKSKISAHTNRGMQLMHHKMALIDENYLIFGSTNWTKGGFEKNNEILVILKLDSYALKEIKKLFKYLKWESKPLMIN